MKTADTSLYLKFKIYTGLLILLVTASSLQGILFPEIIYKTSILTESLRPNDFLNIVLGVPLLSVVLFNLTGKKIHTLLQLTGGLLYIFYNYIAYIFLIPFSYASLFYYAIVALCIYTGAGILLTLKNNPVDIHLSGKSYSRAAGIILLLFGTIFTIRAGILIIGHFLGDEPDLSVQTAVAIADILISPLWVLTGILIIMKKLSGYLLSTGVLIQGVFLFAGLLFFFILQNILGYKDFPVADFTAVFLMFLVFTIPAALHGKAIHKAITLKSSEV